MRNRNPLPLGGKPKEPKLVQAPFPGMIDQDRWRLEPGRPAHIRRDEEGNTMRVPFDDEAAARKIRLHEQAHVRLTPRLEPGTVLGCDQRTVNATEDARIIQYMNGESDDWRTVNESALMLSEQAFTSFRMGCEKLAAKMAGDEEQGAGAPEPVEIARTLAAHKGYLENGRFRQIAEATGMVEFVALVDALHEKHLGSKEHPTFDDAVRYAIELEQATQELAEEGMEERQEVEEANLPMMPDEEERPTQWAPMEIERLPLTERLKGAMSKRTKPSNLGAVPRYMHRLVSDQKVFGQRRKQRRFQGTVLIDHSGSMSLHPSQVDEILRRWPAVTIATYSGYSERGMPGKLRIVAEKGKRVAINYLNCPGAGANAIDGPALDWLTKQKGPRIWISDGRVTGDGEHIHSWYSIDAARKVNRAKITRIDRVQDLLGT